MSDRILNEKSSSQETEFNALSEIDSINDKIIQNDEFSLLSNEEFHELSNQITSNQLSSSKITNNLNSIFGERVKGNFESYRRAGKFFFRCEHNEGKEYSQLIANLLKILIEKNMKKTNIHYIITPKSASAVFR